MTSVHRQGELDNCQSLLDQSRVECKELASKVHSLQNDIDKHKVQTSIAGVSGVSALALMEHFAGVASAGAGDSGERALHAGHRIGSSTGFSEWRTVAGKGGNAGTFFRIRELHRRRWRCIVVVVVSARQSQPARHQRLGTALVDLGSTCIGEAKRRSQRCVQSCG